MITISIVEPHRANESASLVDRLSRRQFSLFLVQEILVADAKLYGAGTAPAEELVSASRQSGAFLVVPAVAKVEMQRRRITYARKVPAIWADKIV